MRAGSADKSIAERRALAGGQMRSRGSSKRWLRNWKPLDPVGSVRIAVHVTVAAAIVIAIVGVFDRDAVGNGAGFWWALSLSIPFVFVAPYRIRAAARQRPLVQYISSAFGIAAITAFVVVATGGADPHRYALLFALLVVVNGAFYPPAGQVVMQATVMIAFVGVMWSSGMAWPPILLQAGLLAVVAYVSGRVAARAYQLLRERTKARDEAETRAELLLAVARMSRLDPEEVIDSVVDSLSRLGFEMANVAVADLEADHFVSKASRGFVGWQPSTLPMHAGLGGQAFDEDRTIAVNDYAQYERRLDGRDEVRGAVATPLRVRGEKIGVLIGAAREPRAPSARQIEIVEALAGHAGRALELARAYEVEQHRVEELRDLDQLKTEFLSNVSHDLRTPLAVIETIGETLSLHRDGLSTDATDQLLSRLNANTSRLRAMIDELLDYSRLESGRMQVRPRLVDLSMLAMEVVTRLETLADHHEVRVAAEPGIQAVADPGLIQHVLENLLGNAYKHTPPGTRVVVSVKMVGEDVEVAVRDDGPGVPDSELPRLAERFYRGSSSTEGLGLGLSMAAMILESHGTELEIESEEGVGTRFRFRLPGAGTSARMSS